MEYLDHFCSVYMDNIIIYSEDLQSHPRHVQSVLAKLRQAGLYADLGKCEFHVQEIPFLGSEGVRTDVRKLETDASNGVVAGVLSQEYAGTESAISPRQYKELSTITVSTTKSCSP